MAGTVDLLFFDTFAHESTEELNLDLVQFPKPVYVTEVRIIPLGARVHADFPGGVRLGATNPTQFSIEFFVNDLGKPGASTFETLGGFEYNQNSCINLECTPDDSIRKIPTDGLVLRGYYTTITLAVYGVLTANIPEQIIQPTITPSIPPQANLLPDVPNLIPVSAIKVENNEWNQENVQPVPVEYTQQPTPAYAQTYPPPEQFKQEYPDYYTEVPKDPRSYHNTPETDWDTKSRGRPTELDRDRTREGERYPSQEVLDRDTPRSDRDRSRHYPRSHSQDRDWQSRGRDYRESNEWEHEYREHQNMDWEQDRDRNYKHQDNYRRSYGHDDNREDRHIKSSKARTPPGSSPKRPHTPHVDKKVLSPVKLDNLSDEDFNNVEKQEKVWEGQINKTVIEKVAPLKEVQDSSPITDELRMDVEEFEPILSDEDILDDSEHFQDLDFDYTSYTNNDDLIKLFIPGTTALQKYQKTPVFNVTNASIEINGELKAVINVTDDFFRSSITKYSLNGFEKLNAELKEEFIHLCEKVMSTIGESENFCHIIKLYCLTKDMGQSELSDTDKEIINQVKGATETLIDWIKIALDYEMANLQNQPPYKIRHIKCGIRLANWCCNSEEFIKLLWQQNCYIHEVLLNLYNQEYMALSIKLMILHALDTYLLHKSAIECFIAGHDNKENGFSDTVPLHSQNGYKGLIEIINKNPSVRIKFALQSILKKLNMFEILSKLFYAVAKLRHNISKIDDIDLIQKSLDQILTTYRSGCFMISQPKRFLPVSAQFDINRSETKNVFVTLFSMHHLIECCTLLLSLPNTTNSWTLKTSIFEIISELLLSSEGLNYLYDNCDSINILLKILLQSDEVLRFIMPSSAKVLGLRIAYFLQCQYHIDCLLDIGGKHKFNCDVPEIMDQLHAMFCLTFSNIGKLACAKLLGFDSNMKALLQFLDFLHLKEKSELHLTRVQKSPGMGYIIDLIGYTIIYNSDITVIENYMKPLLSIINQQELFDAVVAVRINEFATFIKPMESLLMLNYSNITHIVEIVAKYLDTVTTFPGQLIAALRILQHLGITKYPPLNENTLNNYTELKYKYVIIQLFSNDGIATFSKILQNICEFYEQPSLHTATFVSHQGVYIINVIEPCVNLLYQILSYVIQCRNTNFKDITTIPVLLQTYNLLRTFPTASPMYFTARHLCVKIIDTLLVYTQPVSDEVNEKDSLNKTLWALMCSEVIKYINCAPHTFISGLLIFSEVLPIPLPIQTRYELTSEEVSFSINLRKLWSAHLHAFSSNIQEFINRLCTSNNPSLLSLLRKVCIQLADLAANSAIMMARGILDTVYNVLISEEDTSLQPCTLSTARLLNLLACLVTHSSLKCAILHFLYANNPNIAKGDEKYSNLIQAFAKFLNSNIASTIHIQAQECLLSIIQSLCDSEITLLQNTDLPSDVYLANSLPVKETLLTFITIMIDHLMVDNSFVTYLPIVRTLLLLTEHDYGFYHLREYLNKKSEPFLNILNKLVVNFSNDNVEYLATLNTLMELLRVFVTPAEIIETVTSNPRTMKMLPSDIKLLVGWKDVDESGEVKHPLYMLEELLKKNIEDDKTFENYLLEGVSTVINILKGSSNESRDSYTEPVVPMPMPLLAQFAGRTVFTISDIVDEQITSVYWLSTPSDEGHCDVENVTCDLTEICRQNLPIDINIIREVERLCRTYPSNIIEQDDSKSKGLELQKEKTKKTFVTPVARRGFSRNVQPRSDVFRSRPPNTSRPPSLHVDDFVALETCGAQPTGPTGYNKISRELLSTSRVNRGSRGRSFVSCERTAQYRQMSWWSSGFARGPY